MYDIMLAFVTRLEIWRSGFLSLTCIGVIASSQGYSCSGWHSWIAIPSISTSKSSVKLFVVSGGLFTRDVTDSKTSHPGIATN